MRLSFYARGLFSRGQFPVKVSGRDGEALGQAEAERFGKLGIVPRSSAWSLLV